jgi:hypothetical protein
MSPDLKKSLDEIRHWLANIQKDKIERTGLSAEEKKQLLAVNRTIEQLRKLNVPIPDDLRKIKLRLGTRDTEDNPNPILDSNLQAIDELIRSLGELINQAKRIRGSLKPSRKGSGTKKHFGVQLTEIIEAGFLSTDSKLELQWQKNGEIFKGQLRSDGRVAVRTSLGWKEYNSPSTAASATAGHSLNGWDHWRLVEPSGRRVPLSMIRDQYISKGKT